MRGPPVCATPTAPPTCIPHLYIDLGVVEEYPQKAFGALDFLLPPWQAGIYESQLLLEKSGPSGADVIAMSGMVMEG